MIINIHAGHNPDGKTACGAVGFLKESTEARKVKTQVAALLRQMGHTVYDCTVDDGSSQTDVLRRIVEKCNAREVDFNISIHFNAGAGDLSGNGKTAGTEIYLFSGNSKLKPIAENICSSISKLGFRNRGVKCNPNLYVLRNTWAPSMLIECCFVDDKDDVERYDDKKMAQAIVNGITGADIGKMESTVYDSIPAVSKDSLYKVQCGAFADRRNADNLAMKLKEAGFSCFVLGPK